MVEPPRFLAATPGGGKIERLGESDGHSGVDELLRTAPLLASLPSVVHVRGADGRPPAALASTLELIRHELAGVAPGTELVVTRLTDVLLAQALRIFLGTRNDVGSLADPLVAAAIRHV